MSRKINTEEYKKLVFLIRRNEQMVAQVMQAQRVMIASIAEQKVLTQRLTRKLRAESLERVVEPAG